MIIDPDKKVAKAQEKREANYKSQKDPEHFGNEGDEYIERTASRKDVKNTMPEDNKNSRDAEEQADKNE